eukprot:8003298-Alexandrium_andersonii.AAC.1
MCIRDSTNAQTQTVKRRSAKTLERNTPERRHAENAEAQHARREGPKRDILTHQRCESMLAD